MKKICGKCNIEKDIECFGISNKNKDKHQSWCKVCKTGYYKEYSNKNKEKLTVYGKEYYKKNKEKIKKYQKNNKEQIAERTKEYYNNNKEYFAEYKKKYRNNNKLKIAEYNVEYKKNHKDKITEYAKEYINSRRKIDINFKLRHYLGKRIRVALNNNQKSGNTIKLLGCTISVLKQWLGIIGNNYDSSQIHLDHICPASLYDLSKESEQLKCFNYRNLRLLDAKENLIKSNKLDMSLIKLYSIEDLLPEQIIVKKV